MCRKNVVWDEENLEYNEANKSATMKIDEPKTPWASPPASELGERTRELSGRWIGMMFPQTKVVFIFWHFVRMFSKLSCLLGDR